MEWPRAGTAAGRAASAAGGLLRGWLQAVSPQLARTLDVKLAAMVRNRTSPFLPFPLIRRAFSVQPLIESLQIGADAAAAEHCTLDLIPTFPNYKHCLSAAAGRGAGAEGADAAAAARRGAPPVDT